MITDKKKYEEIIDNINRLQQEEQNIIVKNMPKFARGVAEASVERERDIWVDVKAVMDKHNISPSISMRLQTDNQSNEEEKDRPLLVVAGIMVTMQYLVNPVDLTGKDGHLPQKVLENIGKLRETRDILQRELESVS